MTPLFESNTLFVHNSLNAIQYFIQRNEVELSENYLSKFSQLIRLFFEYSRRQHISIKEEIELLTNYLEIEKLLDDSEPAEKPEFKKESLKQLQEKLEKAVQNEDYELAVKIRDEINKRTS